MKPNKFASEQRKKEIIKQNAGKTNRPAKGQDERAVQDTKGKNRHAACF